MRRRKRTGKRGRRKEAKRKIEKERGGESRVMKGHGEKEKKSEKQRNRTQLRKRK